MHSEIEAKFLNVYFEDVRVRLKKIGAICEQPMRTMRRVLFDYPDERFQKNGQMQRLRVRDEVDKVALNFKSKKSETNYPDELEVVVDSFDNTIKLLEAIGLKQYSFQQSKRETWKYKDVEVVLDEWPWLDTYIEIEGPSEEAIKQAATDLGFDWKDAGFGSVDRAYRQQYPGMTKSESIGDLPEVKFGVPIPQYLIERKK